MQLNLSVLCIMINLAEGCVASQKEKCLSLFCGFCFFFQERTMVTLDHKQACNGSDKDRVLGSLSSY